MGIVKWQEKSGWFLGHEGLGTPRSGIWIVEVDCCIYA